MAKDLNINVSESVGHDDVPVGGNPDLRKELLRRLLLKILENRLTKGAQGDGDKSKAN